MRRETDTRRGADIVEVGWKDERKTALKKRKTRLKCGKQDTS